MKGLTVVGSIIVVAIIVVIGLLAFRSTEPNGDFEVMEKEDTAVEFTDESAGSSSGGSLLQQAPIDEPPTTGPGETSTTAEEPTTSPATEIVEVTISMDDTGFTPATVTVAPGSTVNFVNNGQASHWPASVVHPTHQVLAGFDAFKPLATGETYSYTFAQAGTWAFHDHLNPSLIGSVIVSE
ncbi:cupredoxin domain-containing protein [Patescibacteria group bacterium]|nr:cupredoxin domain-containing protein [Patescibacteria group bacterium]